jgi:hypothetical protein
MPQVSDNFGPLYQSVVLDGTGAGTVTFQATGSNIRLTNVTFFVGTSTKQAQVAIYKGQVAPGNRIFNSNSGSTGASATGNVDLFDGETCFVVWTGGDAGATATATFVGGKIPFGEIKPSALTSQEPIAAGDGSLVFPALKSPNYVAGVSGWYLGRDGDIEVNDAVVRGELMVQKGDGYVHIYNSTSPNNAIIDLQPNDPDAQFPGSVFAQTWVPGASYQGAMWLWSPRSSGRAMAQIILVGEASDASAQAQMYFVNNLSGQLTIEMQGDLTVTRGFSRVGVLADLGTPSIPTGGAGATIVTPTSIEDPYSMISGSTIVIPHTGVWNVGMTARYQSQAVAAGLRQCTIFVNGVEQMPDWRPSTGFNATPITTHIVHPMSLTQGDVVTFRCFQTSGVALNLLAGSRAWAYVGG